MTKICPVHAEPMDEVVQNNVTIDTCRSGCILFENGELNEYIRVLMEVRGHQQEAPYVPRVPDGRRVRDPQRYVTAGTFGRQRPGRGSDFSFDDFFSGSGGYGSLWS